MVRGDVGLGVVRVEVGLAVDGLKVVEVDVVFSEVGVVGMHGWHCSW